MDTERNPELACDEVADGVSKSDIAGFGFNLFLRIALEQMPESHHVGPLARRRRQLNKVGVFASPKLRTKVERKSCDDGGEGGWSVGGRGREREYEVGTDERTIGKKKTRNQETRKGLLHLFMT